MLEAYLQATHYDKAWYKPWRSWALANWDMVTRIEMTSSGEMAPSSFVVSAIEGKEDIKDAH